MRSVFSLLILYLFVVVSSWTATDAKDLPSIADKSLLKRRMLGRRVRFMGDVIQKSYGVTALYLIQNMLDGTSGLNAALTARASADVPTKFDANGPLKKQDLAKLDLDDISQFVTGKKVSSTSIDVKAMITPDAMAEAAYFYAELMMFFCEKDPVTTKNCATLLSQKPADKLVLSYDIRKVSYLSRTAPLANSFQISLADNVYKNSSDAVFSRETFTIPACREFIDEALYGRDLSSPTGNDLVYCRLSGNTVYYIPHTYVARDATGTHFAAERTFTGNWYNVVNGVSSVTAAADLSSVRLVHYEETVAYTVDAVGDGFVDLKGTSRGYGAVTLRVYPKSPAPSAAKGSEAFLNPTITGGYSLDIYAPGVGSKLVDNTIGRLAEFQCGNLPPDVYDVTKMVTNLPGCTIEVTINGVECSFNVCNGAFSPTGPMKDADISTLKVIVFEAGPNQRVVSLYDMKGDGLNSPGGFVTPDAMKAELQNNIKTDVSALQEALLGRSLMWSCTTTDDLSDSKYDIIMHPTSIDGTGVLTVGGGIGDINIQGCDVASLPAAADARVVRTGNNVYIYSRFYPTTAPVTNPFRNCDDTGASAVINWIQFAVNPRLSPLLDVKPVFATPASSHSLKSWHLVNITDIANISDKWTVVGTSQWDKIFDGLNDYWKLFSITLHNGAKAGIPVAIDNAVREAITEHKGIIISLPTADPDSARMIVEFYTPDGTRVSPNSHFCQISGGEVVATPDDKTAYQFEGAPLYKPTNVDADVTIESYDMKATDPNTTDHMPSVIWVNENGAITQADEIYFGAPVTAYPDNIPFYPLKEKFYKTGMEYIGLVWEFDNSKKAKKGACSEEFNGFPFLYTSCNDVTVGDDKAYLILTVNATAVLAQAPKRLLSSFGGSRRSVFRLGGGDADSEESEEGDGQSRRLAPGSPWDADANKRAFINYVLKLLSEFYTAYKADIDKRVTATATRYGALAKNHGAVAGTFRYISDLNGEAPDVATADDFMKLVSQNSDPALPTGSPSGGGGGGGGGGSNKDSAASYASPSYIYAFMLCISHVFIFLFLYA